MNRIMSQRFTTKVFDGFHANDLEFSKTCPLEINLTDAVHIREVVRSGGADCGFQVGISLTRILGIEYHFDVDLGFFEVSGRLKRHVAVRKISPSGSWWGGFVTPNNDLLNAEILSCRVANKNSPRIQCSIGAVL